MIIRDVLRYRLLGPLVVERDGVGIDLGPPKQRAMLAVLAHEAGRVISTDWLATAVWGDDWPASVQSSLHSNVSRLRRLLREGDSSPPPITRFGTGYRLDTEAAEFDVRDFLDDVRGVNEAVEGRQWRQVVVTAERALGLWRGDYLADLGDAEWVRSAEVPLTERRAGVAQSLIVGLLGTGDITGAVARSTAVVAEQPLVERAAWLHMVALHRAGRSPEALDMFRRFTSRLDAELGLDPGMALRDLNTDILRQNPDTLAWPGPSSELPNGRSPVAAAPGREPEVRPAPVSLQVSPTPERSPLVGRGSEQAEITALLQAARRDGARWLVLSGPPGIGKTRLTVEALRIWARLDGDGSVARSACPDLDEVPSWWPVRQLLRAIGSDPDDMLAAAGVDDDGGIDMAHYRAIENGIAAIRGHLRRGPLLIVVDDLHWADHASLTFLSMLAESVTEPGLAVVVTTRANPRRPELDRLLAAIARRAGNRQLTVAALPVSDVAELVENVSGHRPDAAEAAELTDRTGGTPFHVVEYARMPEAERVAGRTPPAIRTVLRRRFAALPPDLLAVLRVAATLGEPIDVRLTAHVEGRPVDEIADFLDDAADLDLVVPAVDSAAYVFAHALLRTELTAEVPELRRRRLQAKAADALADAVDLTGVLRRASHLQAAGPLADAGDSYRGFRAAAELAERESLSAAAATWWTAALTAFDRLPGSEQADRDALVATQARALAWSGQGQALLDTLDAELIRALRAGQTGSVGRLAATLLRMSGSWPWPVYGSDPAPLMTTLQGVDDALRDDPGARARVLAVLANGRCYDPDPTVPDSLSRRAIELAEGLGDPDVLADALLGRAIVYGGVASRSAESIELLDRLADLPHELAATDAVIRHNLLTMATINLGLLDESSRHLHAGAVGADTLRMPVNRVQFRWHEASLAQWSGDLRRAQALYDRAEYAHRATDLQQAGTFELAELVLAWDRGLLAGAVGEVPNNPMIGRWTSVAVAAAGGRPGCDEALSAEVLRPEPDVWTSHGRFALLAHCVADRGLAALAPTLLSAMIPLRDCLATFGQVGTLGPVALAVARLARLIGDHEMAREMLGRATALASRAGGASALLHCRWEAALWTADDDSAHTTQWHAELSALVREADDRGMTGIADRARTLLRR